jgi:hypothetical protein
VTSLAEWISRAGFGLVHRRANLGVGPQLPSRHAVRCVGAETCLDSGRSEEIKLTMLGDEELILTSLIRAGPYVPGRIADSTGSSIATCGSRIQLPRPPEGQLAIINQIISNPGVSLRHQHASAAAELELGTQNGGSTGSVLITPDAG